MAARRLRRARPWAARWTDAGPVQALDRAHGMRCLAAAIFNEHREPVAGLSLSGPVARLQDGTIARLGPALAAAAAEITRLVGGVGSLRAGAT